MTEGKSSLQYCGAAVRAPEEGFIPCYPPPYINQLFSVSHSIRVLQTGHRTITAGMPDASSVIFITLFNNLSIFSDTPQLLHICLLATGNINSGFIFSYPFLFI